MTSLLAVVGLIFRYIVRLFNLFSQDVAEVDRCQAERISEALPRRGPPEAAWYAEARMQHLVDGPDEVHRWRIGRNVLAAQRKSGTTAAAARGDLF